MLAAIIVKAPLTSPLPPNPATARPIISIFEFNAAPQKIEPSSNRKRNERKVN